MDELSQAVRRSIAILDAELDRKQPMRFVRHQDAKAFRERPELPIITQMRQDFREIMERAGAAALNGASQKVERIATIADLVRQGKVYLPHVPFRETARLLNAGEYRGGPLVV